MHTFLSGSKGKVQSFEGVIIDQKKSRPTPIWTLFLKNARPFSRLKAADNGCSNCEKSAKIWSPLEIPMGIASKNETSLVFFKNLRVVKIADCLAFPKKDCDFSQNRPSGLGANRRVCGRRNLQNNECGWLAKNTCGGGEFPFSVKK